MDSKYLWIYPINDFIYYHYDTFARLCVSNVYRKFCHANFPIKINYRGPRSLPKYPGPKIYLLDYKTRKKKSLLSDKSPTTWKKCVLFSLCISINNSITCHLIFKSRYTISICYFLTSLLLAIFSSDVCQRHLDAVYHNI